MKGYNTVPSLSDDRFFMTAAFVQESTTDVTELNTKLEGKRKLHWQSCLVWNSMKGKAVSWTKYQQNSKPSILNLPVGRPPHQKTDRPWKTSWLASGNAYKMNFVQGFEISQKRRMKYECLNRPFITYADQVPVQMKRERNKLQNNYSMRSAFTLRNIRHFHGACLKILTASKFEQWNC